MILSWRFKELMRVYLNLKVTQNGLFSHFVYPLSIEPTTFPLKFPTYEPRLLPRQILHIRNPLYLEYSRHSEILQNDTFVKSILIKKKNLLIYCAVTWNKIFSYFLHRRGCNWSVLIYNFCAMVYSRSRSRSWIPP